MNKEQAVREFCEQHGLKLRSYMKPKESTDRIDGPPEIWRLEIFGTFPEEHKSIPYPFEDGKRNFIHARGASPDENFANIYGSLSYHGFQLREVGPE